MMDGNLFITARICGIGIILGALAGCVSKPETVTEEAPPPGIVVTEKEDDVWDLLAKGETDKARRFFMGETDVNATDSQGKTALHYAAENKDPLLAAFFINMGAQVDAQDNDSRTPLAISAEKLDPPTAKTLVLAGANIHFPMTGNTSPARIAVGEGGEFLEAFLSPGALSSFDSSGRTILHIAAETGNARSAEAILGADNNINQKDINGKTALDIALERTDSRNHAETAELLIQTGAVSENRLYAYFAPAAKSSNYNIRGAGGMAPLHYTAREGYMGFLEFILEKKADVNIKNASGATPLHEAARAGNLTAIETLLDHGADVNIQDANGNSVLHLAIPQASRETAVKLFLSRGANPNLRDKHGYSPLHVAVILDRSEKIPEALLTNGADVSIRDVDGKTPLYLALEKNRPDCMSLLLANKSDIFAADNEGITPFEKALRDHPSLLFGMITKDTVLQSDSAGNTMLHVATAEGGNPGVMNHILDYGAPVNARNKAGDTSLTIAVRINAEAAGTLLLNRGADIFAVNARSESPLSLAFPPPGRDASELRQWMLTTQTLSARDGLGNTALHYAAQWRLDFWIPLLVEKGARTEAANATGETPLFIAVRQDSPGNISALKKSGADINNRDTLGNSLLHAAIRWHSPMAVETLISLGLDINCYALNGKTPLHDSIRLGMTDIEKILLDRGADIEIRDAEGNTPFVEAVYALNPVTMKELVNRGADPNTRNFRGDTPLHICAAMGRNDLAELLLGWGASIHARNARGRTPYQDALITSPNLVLSFLGGHRLYTADDNGSSPLHIAVEERASPGVIKSIMELGAKTSSVDFEGRTPLRLAADLKLWETAKLLADSGASVFVTARDGKTAAEVALLNGETAVRALFSGAAINSRDSSGNTILHYAARQGGEEMISLLLSMGADKTIKNIASESPAEIAGRWNHPNAATLLN